MVFTDEQRHQPAAFSAGFHRSFMDVSSIEDRAAAEPQGASKAGP
jgi:hypothetical protein